MEFELAGFWYFHKVGLLRTFKNTSPKLRICYIDQYDYDTECAVIRCFIEDEDDFAIFIDGERIHPLEEKIIYHDFTGKTFLKERRIYVSFCSHSLGKLEKNISTKLNGGAVSIDVKGRKSNSHKISDIHKAFKTTHSNLISPKYVGSWIFIDRDTQADDNAEHLYRYVQKNFPDKKIYFSVKQTSPDWNRLQQDGFKLIDFGSNDYEIAIRSCKMLVSSHIDAYIVNYFRNQSLLNKKIIFLQHGVTKDDMSSWFNTKKIDIICCTTPAEYNSIAENGTPYYISPRVAQLTGFARHDRLIEMASERKKDKLLICPTWRQHLVGGLLGKGNERIRLEGVGGSNYVNSWRSVLNSPELLEFAQENDLDIVLYPHPNMKQYISDFRLSDYVNVLTQDKISVQDLLASAAVLITDFSSIAFDSAIVNCPIIYYQFDEDEVFGGGHTTDRGYFDYHVDGFGPVVSHPNEVFCHLYSIAKNGFNPTEQFQRIIDDTFPLRDGKCCERIYDSICELEKSQPAENKEYISSSRTNHGKKLDLVHTMVG